MKNIEIYTSDTCIQCIKVRELIRMGYMSIPVILIDGEHVLGFDLNRIESLLQK